MLVFQYKMFIYAWYSVNDYNIKSSCAFLLFACIFLTFIDDCDKGKCIFECNNNKPEPFQGIEIFIF